MHSASGIFGLVAGLTMLVATALAAPSSNTANANGIYAGPVNMNEACNFQHGAGWAATLNGNGGNDWRCVNSSHQGSVVRIDVDKYCKRKYGKKNGLECHADIQGGGAYDWGCYWR